jgi:hypothetical protein
VFAGIATNLQTYVMPGGGNKVALSMEVADMDALDAMLKSEAGAAAMKYDGVHPDTLMMYVEG